MANQEHLDILKRGVEAWNLWRQENIGINPDLSSAKLGFIDLTGVNFSNTDLSSAYLRFITLKAACLRDVKLIYTDIVNADFSDADLSGADLRGADLNGANFNSANLRAAKLNEANLSYANFSNADLTGSSIRRTQLIKTRFNNAVLTDCSIFGASAWGVELDGAVQRNLIISDVKEPTITVDNLEVAQFIYLLLNNQRIRDVINTITSKAVLILGRFTPERKAVLDAIREKLRKRDYLPLLFDFEQPSGRNLTETVATLAHLSRFVIADITDARSIPQELQRIIPDLPSLPVQPIILDTQYEYGMFEDFFDYPWVLTPYRYHDIETLLISLEENVIGPAAAKAKEIEDRRKAFEQKIKQ